MFQVFGIGAFKFTKRDHVGFLIQVNMSCTGNHEQLGSAADSDNVGPFLIDEWAGTQVIGTGTEITMKFFWGLFRTALLKNTFMTPR